MLEQGKCWNPNIFNNGHQEKKRQRNFVSFAAGLDLDHRIVFVIIIKSIRSSSAFLRKVTLSVLKRKKVLE